MNHQLWAVFVVENPQSNTAANGTTAISGTTGGSGFNSLNNNSFSDRPDVIAKVAYEAPIAGHNVHVEGFGIVGKLNERVITGADTGYNNSISTFGYGGSINVQVVPKLLDAQFSGFGGKGIGRYGSAGLADGAFSSGGRIHPPDEFKLLDRLNLHATKVQDLYAFGGEQQEMLTRYAPTFWCYHNFQCRVFR